MLSRIESNDCGSAQSAQPPRWGGTPRDKKGKGGGREQREEEKKKSDRERETVRETLEKIERMKGEAARSRGGWRGVPRAPHTSVSGGPTEQ